MLVGSMRLNVPARLNDAFIKRAKEMFPRECFAHLLGSVDDNGTRQIEELIYPADLDANVTTGQVNIQHSWLRAARRRAKQISAVVLGDIHSHPYTLQERMQAHKNTLKTPDTSPSEGDWNRRVAHIMGICTINQGPSGRLRARVRYWGPSISIIEVVE